MTSRWQLPVFAIALAVIVVAGTLVTQATVLAGGAKNRPFTGSTTGTSTFHPPTNNERCAELGLPGVPVCVELSGTTHATHIGNAQYQAVFFPGPPIAELGECSNQIGIGKAKWIAPDESELHMNILANENCVIVDGDPDVWSVVSQFAVTGGTGRFEDASGLIGVSGSATPGVWFSVDLSGAVGY